MPAKPTSAATALPMTAEQAARLKQLAIDAYELDAFKPNLTQAEAQRRIADAQREAAAARRAAAHAVMREP